jgi:1-acyl-sn-glycerol-3-phosphate acyltransferase
MKNIIRLIWVAFHIIIVTILVATFLVILGPFDKHRYAGSFFGKLWSRWVLWASGIKISVQGIENLDTKQQYVFTSNHESAFDIPICTAGLVHRVVFLAKKELFRIPFFGWAMWGAGMIKVDRQNKTKAKKSVDKAVQKLQNANMSVIVYPEGTRSKTKEMLPFKRGSFIIAIKAKLPVVPVAIVGARERLNKHSFTINPGSVRLIVGKPIPTINMVESDRHSLMKETEKAIQLMRENS